MPSHKQVTVNAVVTNKDKGRHDSKTMSTIFAASPIHTSEMTAESIRQQFQELCLDGDVNDAGHTFGILNRDYSNAPDYGDVETGGGGLPASAWLPNPNSPGPGSQTQRISQHHQMVMVKKLETHGVAELVHSLALRNPLKLFRHIHWVITV